jgi:hypothetical protein
LSFYEAQSARSVIRSGFKESDMKLSSIARGPPKIHLAFLFASPLMYQVSEHRIFDGVPPISFNEEFEGIISGMEKLQKKFKYRYCVANENNLLECLNL